MTSRMLKIALAVSVALNLFAAAAAVTVVVTRAKVDEKVQAQNQPQRNTTFRQILGQMKPEVRERVHTTLRASAMAARPDFEEARAARREAIALTGQPSFDAVQVRALLDKSIAAELRGRTRLETDAVRLLSTLDEADRKALSQILRRHVSRSGRGSSAPPHAAGTPPPAQ